MSWTTFYEATQERKPYQALVKAITLFADKKGEAAASFAIDLGCGAGSDTLALLDYGWHVLAIDKQPEAISRLLARATSNQQVRLQTQVISFEEVVLPPADLVNASFSLPFCPPHHFDQFWAKIVCSLRPGGCFVGQFFGEHDDWARNPAMTFHTAAQIEQLLAGFEVEFFKEVDEDGQTAVGHAKHWHVFSIVARRLDNPLLSPTEGMR
jgi:tellurite methyltransferase